MKNIVVALTKDSASNFLSLPPSFNFKGYNIIVHRNPLVEFNGDLVCNFDLMIDFGQSEICKLIPEKCISFPRINKTYQLFNLSKAAKSLGTSHIYIPKVYFNTDRSGCAKEYAGLSKHSHNISDENVVVKLEQGARGLGQAVVPTNELNYFLDNCSSTVTELIKKFPNVKFGQMKDAEVNFYEEQTFNTKHLCVMEYIDKIETEYRILFNGSSNILCVKRNIRESELGFRQANIILGEPVKNAKITSLKAALTIEYDSDIAEVMVDELVGLLNKLDIIGSVDLFVKNGMIGIIEYCNQFGYYGYDLNTIRKFHQDCIVNYLMDKNLISQLYQE
jgi:hypothetical protein